MNAKAGATPSTTCPLPIRNRAKERGLGPISHKYTRICFDKEQIHHDSKPEAAFVCPGRPLLDATISLMRKRENEALKRGAMLVDPSDPSKDLRVLFYLEGAIQDAVPSRSAEHTVISREVRFVEIDSAGTGREAGTAPPGAHQRTPQ